MVITAYSKDATSSKITYFDRNLREVTIADWVQYPANSHIECVDGLWRIQNDSNLSTEIILRIRDAEDFLIYTHEFVSYPVFEALYRQHPGRLFTLYKNNPYFLCDTDLDAHVPFSKVDSHMQIDTFEMRLLELKAAMDSVANQYSGKGDTCVPMNTFIQSVSQILDKNNHHAERELILAALHCFDKDFAIIGDYITSKKIYTAERIIYNAIQTSLSARTKCFKYQPVATLSEEQNEVASKLAIATNLSGVTGGPGTGKTTSIANYVTQYQQAYPDDNVYLLAPTNKACARIKETFSEADCTITTVHKFIGFGHKVNKQDIERMQSANLIIIDECSMLGAAVFAALLNFIDIKKTKVILMGDVDQLPSVEPGEVFADVISSKIPVFRLTFNFRSKSSIVQNAHHIIAGAFPTAKGAEFHLRHLTPEAYSSLLHEQDVTILSPYRKEFTVNGDSILGNCTTINREKHAAHIQHYLPFAPGEPIICVKANKAAGYFNGQTGTVVSVENKKINVKFDGETEIVQISNLADIELAYAITVHKSEGSEYNNVSILLPVGCESFCTRQMLYTAVTRAKQQVNIYVEPQTLYGILNNNTKNTRRTNLKIMLESKKRGVAA